MVTHPQSIIFFSAAKHQTQAILLVLSSIPSIWEDKHIEKLEDNQWKCLWCYAKFQGINATKGLSCVIGAKSMHIKRCTASIDQAYLSRYKELQKIKAAKKGLLMTYPVSVIWKRSFFVNNH